MPDSFNKLINFRQLDLNLLRVFDEVMSERNLTRAQRAEALRSIDQEIADLRD